MKQTADEQATSPTPTSSSSSPNVTDFECPLCLKLLFDPTTSPCGHSFCCSCAYELIQAASKNNATTTSAPLLNNSTLKCPLCRTPIDRRWKPTSSIALGRLLASTFCDAYQTRAQQATPLPRITHWNDFSRNDEEQEDESFPLFVLEPLLPGQRMYLHVFEMRYRLMMQHVMQQPQQDSGRRPQFGMVGRQGDGEEGVAQYGTRAEIESCHCLPDGRFQVVIQGKSMFRIVECEFGPFGYWQAHVVPVDLELEQQQQQQQHEGTHQDATLDSHATTSTITTTITATSDESTMAMTEHVESTTAEAARQDANDADGQELVQQALERYHTWAKRVVENQWERRPNHLQHVLDILGPMPTTTKPGNLAAWVAAAINPLPPLGVAREIRPAILAARTPTERLQIVKDALDESLTYIQYKRGTMDVGGVARVDVWIVYSVVLLIALAVWLSLQCSMKEHMLQQFGINREALLGVYGLTSKILLGSGEGNDQASEVAELWVELEL